MAQLQVDQGHKVLNDLIDAFGKLTLSDANEAETRFKVIDGMLRKVLGWQDDDISVEAPLTEDGHTDFTDYRLSTAAVSIIVEAKRAGAAFTLPHNHKSGKLGGALSTGEIGNAIRQARDYCRKTSTQFAVVTNGSAWIIFPAVRTDQVSFEQTQARIFRDLDDVHHRFVEFWELLSRQRVIEGNLENELLGRPGGGPIRRALHRLRDVDFRMDRNSLYPYFGDSITAILTDDGLLSNAEALEFCYVKNTERTAFDTRLKMHLSDPKQQLNIPATRVRTSRKSYDYLDRKIQQTVQSGSRFFLIIGSVGAGKSTFLAYTRLISASSVIDKKVIWLYVDFKKATKTDEPRRFIYERLRELIERDKDFGLGDWEKTIQPAYSEEIANLARGPLFLLKRAAPDQFDQHIAKQIGEERDAVVPYVDKVLNYSSRKIPCFIAIDNVDQIEDDERQNQIFAEAQALAQKHGLQIILSLRDTTFQKYRNSATFNAFELDAIYVDPPSAIPVLARRFAYARKLLSGVKADLVLEGGATFKAGDIGAFFEIAAQSLLSGENAELIDTLAGGDIRRGLTLTREFLASGHVTADIALSKYLTDREWRIPAHEIFKGAVLGGRRVYREEDSLLPNMYCAKLGSSQTQLLRLNLCEFFVHQARGSKYEGSLCEEVVAFMHQLGVSEYEVMTVLQVLVGTSVLRTIDGSSLASTSRLVPTRLAGYFVHQLMGQFNYAEMCTLDAHIYDEQVWDNIASLTDEAQAETNKAKRLAIRIKRVNAFIDYLESVEERWAIEVRRRNLGGAWSESPIHARIKPLVLEDCKRAIQSAELNQTRKAGYKH